MRRPLGNDLQLGAITGGRGELTLLAADRAMHLHVVGATGTGKSKFLEHLIRQDILNWRKSRCGLLVIDPHGSLYASLMRWLAWEGINRPVIPIELSRDDWVVGYNLLRPRRVADGAVIVENAIQAIAHVWGTGGTDQTPLFARRAANVLQALYEKGLTLVEAIHLVSANRDLRVALTGGLSDQLASRDWEVLNSLSVKDFEAQVSSTLNRLLRFVNNPSLRCVFGVPQHSLDLGQTMQDGSIILVSLAQEGARVTQQDVNLFATLLVSDLWVAAKERGKREGVKPFYVYIDEFQKFLTPTIAQNLDEARGFGLHLTLAHQFPKQLSDAGEIGRQVYNSVMENARSKVVFHLSDDENLKPMAQWLFRGVMDPDQVKHDLYSTKVMNYRLEYEKSFGSSRTAGHSKSHQSSLSEMEGSSEDGGFGVTETQSDRDGGALEDLTISTSRSSRAGSSRSLTRTSSDGESLTESQTESETQVPMLKPLMGRELSGRQYRSLEEQLFRAMAVLFDQQQRQGVARLVGMTLPVSIVTPTVKPGIASDERVQRYIDGLLAKLPCALPRPEAVKILGERQKYFANEFLKEVEAIEEPASAKRRLP